MAVRTSERMPCTRKDAFALFLKHGNDAGYVARKRAWCEPEWPQALRWWKVADAIAADFVAN